MQWIYIPWASWKSKREQALVFYGKMHGCDHEIHLIPGLKKQIVNFLLQTKM